MCGIAGFVDLWPPGALARALAAMALRGPDGTFMRQLPGWHLGAVRLAVTDLEHGTQPFTAAAASYICFAAGEIYNAPELRVELTRRGARFQTQCDLEVLPHAWSAWGPTSLVRLEGMFAVALWDQREQCLYLFRDATGQKPLYWTQQGAGFAFASEVRGLRAAGLDLQVEIPQLAAFMALRYLSGPQTAFRGVHELPPGHLLAVKRGEQPRLSRWDHPREHPQADLAICARQAVARATRADVPRGLYLSGGVDSAFLARTAAAQGLVGPAITLTFAGALSEAEGARAIAQAEGFSHHEVTWRTEDLQRLPDLVARLENPVGDVIILAFDLLAEKAAKLGVRVILSGEGPDEWFCGYGFHRAHVLAARLSVVPGLLGALATAMPVLGALAPRLAGLGQPLGADDLRRVADWLRGWPAASHRERADGLRRLFTSSEMRGLVHPELCRQWHLDLDDLEPLTADDLRSILLAQCQGWLPGWVSGRQEKIAMARGIEVRMPLLDAGLRDLALDRLAATPFRGWLDKPLWRRLLRASGIAGGARSKQAFSPPAVATVRSATFIELDASYLNADSLRARGWFNPDALQALRARARAGSLLAAKQWSAILMLEMWARHYLGSAP